MKNKIRKRVCAMLSILGIIPLAQSCFHSPNQPCLRHTGKLVDAGKSENYYHGYGFFKKNIYYWSNASLGDTPEKLKDVDKETFVILDCSHAKDKNRAYCRFDGDTNIDLPTFEVVTQGEYKFIRDKNYVYTSPFYNLAYGERQPLHASYTNYRPHENKVFQSVPEANPRTYQALGYNWSKDDKNAYFRYLKIDNADAQTFVVINEWFAKDKNSLYAQEFGYMHKLECNTAELVSIDGTRYVHTNNLIYFFDNNRIETYPLKDPTSVEKIYLTTWLKADGKIILKARPLTEPEIDHETFISLGYNYFKDKDKIYNWRTISSVQTLHIITDADFDTFEPTGGFYAKDKNRVYYANEILTDANPDDFRFDERTRRAYSGNNVYISGKKE
jgi:hypothetical protein